MEHREEIQEIKKEDIIYIDESGIEEQRREKGWSLKGKRIMGKIKGKRTKRINILAGQQGKKILAPKTTKENVNREIFNEWLEKELLPKIGPGKVIIMDNASFHKSPKTRALIESKGCKLIYLPPYSPDLNPIEHFWANLKHHLASIIHRFSCLFDSLTNALSSL
jgi:putative transposase